MLTCAHVVNAAVAGWAPTADGGPPSASVHVDFVGYRPAAPSAMARVMPGCWFPPRDDDRADLALLELAAPLPEDSGPILRRLPLGLHRDVRVCGFPERIPNGLWVDARLFDTCGPGGEWVQLNAASTDLAVEAGFSGAPVFHDRTGSVVGIVVTSFTKPGSRLSWMIPVETIINYLPRVREWVSGDSGVDNTFIAAPGPSGTDDALFAKLTTFFAHRAVGGTMIIVVEPDSTGLATLRDVIVRASRELSPAAREQDGSMPPDPLLGSIDLAIDVSHRTATEVSSRILNWMNADAEPAGSLADSLAGEPPAMNVVLDGVDCAADPDSIICEVARPFAHRAAERDIRLLLTFRDKASPSLHNAALELLAARISEVDAAEDATRERHEHVAARVADVPTPSVKTPLLRMSLTTLRMAAALPGDDPILPRIESCRRKADEAFEAAVRLRQRLDEQLDARDRLRDRLASYQARAVDCGLAEDAALAAPYRQARELLWRGRCELPRCAELVDRYAALIRQRCAEPAGGRGEPP